MFTLVDLLKESSKYEKKKKKWISNSKERMDINYNLSKIQEKWMEVYAEIFDNIDQKSGHIKEELLGGMVDYSSRNVIIPDATLKSDEVILNYHTFLELFRYEIIACLVKMDNISENAANEIWYKAKIQNNPKVYEIMKYINKTPRKVIINRNPKSWAII